MNWISDYGSRSSDCSQHLQCAHTARHIRHPKSKVRSGLTLIELLITIAILATLATIFLGVSNAAMESSRAARTKTTISKIHTLLMERWDSYATRRVELNPNLEDAITSLDPDIRGYVAADARLLARRELMMMEMPDRWSDVKRADLKRADLLLADVPGITNIYHRQLTRASSNATPEIVAENQRAECLYMVVMNFTGDGEARTLFSRQDIGDTDGDGAKEFLDGWGRPIFFIRWPAGFAKTSDLMTGDAAGDHDPFDHYRRDFKLPNQNLTPPDSVYSSLGPLEDHVLEMRERLNSEGLSAYRLMPLVYSGGPDGDPDLFGANDALVFDPYREYTSNGITAQLATPMSFDEGIDPTDDGDNWIDNIHNHQLDGS